MKTIVKLFVVAFAAFATAACAASTEPLPEPTDAVRVEPKSPSVAPKMYDELVATPCEGTTNGVDCGTCGSAGCPDNGGSPFCYTCRRCCT